MKKLITHEFFGILVLLTALVPQIAHTVYVFQINSHYPNPWFAWCYAIGVDLAILIFTVRGWIRTAVAYLLATLAHNLAYQFLPESEVSSMLIGVTLSMTIFSFSHLFYSGRHQRSAGAEGAASEDLALRLASALARGIHLEAHPYQCPCCGQTFRSSKQLNGHISGHKMKQEWHEAAYGDWKQENEKRSLLLSQLGIGVPEPTNEE